MTPTDLADITIAEWLIGLWWIWLLIAGLIAGGLARLLRRKGP